MKTFNPLRYSMQVLGALMLIISILWWRTDGFRNYTYESTRRASIANSPVKLSNWQLQSADNTSLAMSSLWDSTVLVDFIYTRCPTVCRALGSRYQQLQQVIDQYSATDVVLLSISIDPEYDTPTRLGLYQQAHLEAHRGQPHSWKLARPVNQTALRTILAETGLRVIADEIWGFSHSDSIHIIKNGYLIRIKDWNSPELETLIENTAGAAYTS